MSKARRAETHDAQVDVGLTARLVGLALACFEPWFDRCLSCMLSRALPCSSSFQDVSGELRRSARWAEIVTMYRFVDRSLPGPLACCVGWLARRCARPPTREGTLFARLLPCSVVEFIARGLASLRMRGLCDFSLASWLAHELAPLLVDKVVCSPLVGSSSLLGWFWLAGPAVGVVGRRGGGEENKTCRGYSDRAWAGRSCPPRLVGWLRSYRGRMWGRKKIKSQGCCFRVGSLGGRGACVSCC